MNISKSKFFRKIYLLLRLNLSTIIILIIGSSILIYLQAQTGLAIISTIFLGHLLEVTKQYREISKQLDEENIDDSQAELPDYRPEPLVSQEARENTDSSKRLADSEKDSSIISHDERQNTNSSSGKIEQKQYKPAFLSNIPLAGAGKIAAYALSIILGTALLFFLISFLYMYFFFYA